MRGLLGALGFLTILPVPGKPGWQGEAMLPWFPLVGLILGGLWAGFDILVGLAFPSLLRAGLDVIFLVVLTGGLHLDGLADTADGLLSHRDRAAALRIMKDSRIGTWGVVSLIAVLGLKTLALSGTFSQGRFLPLLLVPAYGRSAMLLGMWVLPYGRGTEGIAHDLFQSGAKRTWWAAGILLVMLGAMVLGWPRYLIANGVMLGAVALILAFYRARMGCITGDMLGALGEVTEMALLVALAVNQSA